MSERHIKRPSWKDGLVRKTRSSISSSASTVRVSTPIQQPKILPSLASPIGPLRQSFTALGEQITTFMTHINSTVPYRKSLGNAWSACSHDFDVFHVQLQKADGSSSKKSMMSHATARNSGQQFLKSWKEVVHMFIEIRASGTASLTDSINTCFDDIFGSLKIVSSNPNPHSSVHDPAVRSVKSLMQNTNTLKKTVQWKIAHPEEVTDEVLCDLRTYARQINLAFTNDFGASSLSIVESEKVRAQAYTACNDIIQGVKSAFTFSYDISCVFRSIDEFSSFLSFFIDKLSLEKKQPQTSEEDENEELLIPEPEVSEEMDLETLLDVYNEYINRVVPNKNKFIDLIRTKINREREKHQQEKAELMQTIERLETEYSTDDDDKVRDCLQDTEAALRIFISNDNKPKPFISDDALINDVEDHLKYLSGWKCTNCEKLRLERNNFVDILSTITPGVSNPVLLAKHAVERVNESHEKINSLEKEIEELRTVSFEYNQVREVFAEKMNTDPDSTLLEQIEEAVNERDEEHAMTMMYQTMARNIEERLGAFLGVTSSNMPIIESVNTLLDTLETSVASDRDRELAEIDTRLRSVLKCETPSSKDYVKRISKLSVQVQSSIETFQREERRRQTELVKSRAILEMTVQKLRRSLSISQDETAKPDLAELVTELADLCDRVSLSLSDQISKDSLNNMFRCVIFDIQTEDRNDPFVFIPDLCHQFDILHQSIKSLDPFIEILNKLFLLFDCKFESFNPASAAFAVVREQTIHLQKQLNAAGTSKMHSSLFLVLSRFVTLVSSFVSAISSNRLSKHEI